MGWGGAMRTRPDEMPHIADRRMSEESETGFIEMGMAPGLRADGAESMNSPRAFVSDGYSPTNYQHQFVGIAR